MKLPKSIIKKYGITKKAWQVFRGNKKAKKTSTKKAVKTKTKVKTLAKRKRSRSRKQDKGMFNFAGLSKPLGGIGYGFVRDRVSDMVANSQIGQNLPASQFTDEAVMLAIAFGARKTGLTKNKLVGSIVRSGESVEWARIGSTLSDMMQNKQQVATTQTNAPLQTIF